MKTRNLFISKSTLIMILISLLVSSVFIGCSKKDSTDPTPTSQPFSNTGDDSTTRIIASIPRIELSKVKSTGVTLYLSVTDQKGHPFPNFNQYNFVIKQVCIGRTDTAVVTSLGFQKMNQSGQNIATPLVLDYSGSMSSYLADLEQAAAKFITIKNKNDQAELIKFSSSIENVQPFTKDTTALLTALIASWPGSGGSTALYDAMMMGIDDADLFSSQQSSTYLPAIIGFTDGINNASSSTSQDVIDNAIAKQIPVYMLGFGGADSVSLSSIANQTGGRYYYTPDMSTLQSLFSMISGQLKNIYLASWVYSSTCTEVMIIVEASYTCGKGTFYSRTEKIFIPLIK
ncbi:MAG: vWA domain-containing protein [Bacteroidales bacterium]